MEPSVEFEIKAEFPKGLEKEHLLKEFRPLKELVEIDVYYDDETSALFQKGIFLRVRDGNTLDIKYNADIVDVSHTSCDEYRFPYPLSHEDNQHVAEFLQQILRKETIDSSDDVFVQYGLSEFVEIKKNRETYENDSVLIILDDIHDLGRFIEIEAKDHSNADAVLRIKEQHDLAHIPVGYVELFLKKNDYETYKKGRYVLSEDKD